MDTEVFSRINTERVKRWHGESWKRDGEGQSGDWSGADWSNAMCGEAGEAANVVKKIRRMETGLNQAEGKDEGYAFYNTLIDRLSDEIGDVYAYLDLLATYYGIDIGEAIIRKFNAISEREGFPERML